MNDELTRKEIISNLFYAYANDLYRYAYYILGNSSDAKDAVQDTFVHVIRAWGGFRFESDPKTWLWRIARNAITDVARRRQRRRESSTPVDIALEHLPSVSDEPSVELMDAIGRLPMNQRQVVILRLVQSFSTSQTAVALDWSEPKVRSQLHAAVVRLRSDFHRMEQEDSYGL